MADHPIPSASGGGFDLPPRCPVPAKVLRQIRAAWVPAASGVSVGIVSMWSSRGSMAAGDGASIWSLDLALQVHAPARQRQCVAPFPRPARTEGLTA